MSVRRRRRSPSSQLIAPVLAWDGETADATPDFSATLTSPYVGDVVTLNLYSDSGLTTLVDTATNGPTGLTQSDITNGTISLVLGSQADGTYYATLTTTRGSSSATSNTVTVTIDATAPTLSSPGSSAVTATTATISVTTNDATGTLYYVVTTSSTPPSKAQVKAGQNDGGTAAAKSGSQAIASTGAKTADLTALSSSTAYYGYWMHEDANGNQSSVSATGIFTTLSAYTQTRVTFDGTNDYISYTSNTSIADSTGLTVSFWLDTANTNATTFGIFLHAGSSGTRVNIQRNSSNKLTWTLINSAGTVLWTGTDTVNFLDADGLAHFAIAYNGAAGTGQYYRNGVAQTPTNSVGPIAGTVNWARNAQASGIFASTTGTAKYNGTVGDFWVSNAYTDLSTNISSFYGGGTPPDLTGFGSPAIWLGGTMTVGNWNTTPIPQLGSATMSMTMNGAVA